MELSGKEVAIFLSEEGRLALAGLGLSDSPLLEYVEETDDLGIWIRVRRPEGEHVVLLRWDYVQCLDLLVTEIKRWD